MSTILLDPGSDATQDNTFWPTVATTLGTFATDSTQSRTGPRSYKSNVTTAGGEAYGRNNSGDGVMAATGRRISFGLRLSTVTPSQDTTVNIIYGSVQIFALNVTTTGKLALVFAGATQVTGATALSANTWYRVSFSFLTTTTSNWSAKVFLDGVQEISATNANGTLDAADPDLFNLGLQSSAVMTAWYDDIYIDDSNAVNDPGSGVAGNLKLTHKRPVANGTANQFASVVGAGGSGYGTGHSPQVNEQPLSATNAWEQSNTTIKTEGYVIEGQSVGDVDMTGATIVDYMGWMRSKVNSTANSPVHRIIVSSVASAKTMTTAAATYKQAAGSTTYPGGNLDIGMSGQYTTTPHVTTLYECGVVFAYNPATGIAFDAASNSGEQLAQSTYSWNHTCTGTNRYLKVGIGMLSLAQTVSGITYNSVAMTFLGTQSSVSGAARVEMWGLVNPSTGANSIAVTLTGAVNSGGVASSYTGVHQTSPTEGFNSAQATNVGAADATVNVTTVADNDWVVDTVVTDDTAITVGAGQTSRNNISGTVGSVGDSDEGPKTPAGSVTMSWTNIGALATWAIGAIALRPIAASTLTTTNSNLSLLGAG